MGGSSRVSIALFTTACILSVTDCVVVSVLCFTMSASVKEFFASLNSFSFGKSYGDLWIISLLRFSLCSGISFGLLRNANVESKRRISFLKRPAFYVMVVLNIYVLVKVLYAIEDLDNHVGKAYATQLGMAFFFNCSMPLSVWMLSRVEPWDLRRKRTEFFNLQEEHANSARSRTSSDSDDDDASSTASDDGNQVDFKGGSAVWKLLSFAKPDLPFIVVAFFFLLAASAAEIFLPLYTGRVIDSIVIEKSSSKFKHSIIMMSAITLAAGVASGARGGLFSYVMARFTNRLQNNLFSCILNQEIGFFDKKRTGAITSRLTSDTAKVGNEISININIFLRNAVKLIGIIIMMARLSWKLTIVTVVGTPVVVLIAEAYGEFYQKLAEAVQESLAKANESADEAISSMRTVRSFAGEIVERRRYRSKLLKTFNLQKKEALVTGGYNLLTQVCDLAIEVIVLFYGGHLVLKGDLNGGVLVSFILYNLELGQCIEEMGEIYTSLMDAVGSAKKVFEYMERKPKLGNGGILAPPEIQGLVEFKDVSFSYPSRPDVIVTNQLSFKVVPGEVVAVVGHSGSGKSTLVNLLQHFYEPQTGSILLDGRQIKDYEHHFYHQKVAVVAQEPVLFARTIAENITYAISDNEDITLNDIKAASELANAHPFIMQMPKGYDTQAGEKGTQLSGGQKQRIAIARAIIRKPALLILDEATSALDAHSENLVQEALNAKLTNTSVIIIAHRLSTIEKADKILVIDHGKLVEQGNHKNLMTNKGYYYSLVERQLQRRNSHNQSNLINSDRSSVSSLSDSEVLTD